MVRRPHVFSGQRLCEQVFAEASMAISRARPDVQIYQALEDPRRIHLTNPLAAPTQAWELSRFAFRVSRTVDYEEWLIKLGRVLPTLFSSYPLNYSTTDPSNLGTDWIARGLYRFDDVKGG